MGGVLSAAAPFALDLILDLGGELVNANNADLLDLSEGSGLPLLHQRQLRRS